MTLGLIDRLAGVLATAISETTAIPPHVAKLQGIAIAAVYRIILGEAGERTREGQSPAQVADALYPVVEDLLDELDRWLVGRA